MASIPKQPFTLPTASARGARFHQRNHLMTTPAPPAGIATDLTLEGVASRQQAILDQMAYVLTEQEACSQALKILEDHVITKDALEDIISKRIMTKQDFDTQRRADEQEWGPAMRQIVTRRWLSGVLASLGCVTLLAMLFFSVLTVSAVLFFTHLLAL